MVLGKPAMLCAVLALAGPPTHGAAPAAAADAPPARAASASPAADRTPAAPTSPPAGGRGGLPTTPDETFARGLMDRLGNHDWQQRQLAEDALVELGPAALPFLQDLLDGSEDAEVRTRLASALKRIKADRTSGPSYVTLHLKDAAPAHAFSELSRQAFTTVKTYPENLWEQGEWPPVTLDVERKPFWAAARAVAAEAGVGLQASDEGLRLVQLPGQLSGPSVVHGPFLVVATHVARSQTIVLGNGDVQPARPAVVRNRSNEFGVHLLVVPEPKLSVIRAVGAVKLEHAVDDHGNNLAPPRNAGGHTYANSYAGAWNLHARLKYPPANPGKTIARLAGNVTFAVQTQSQTIQLDDPLTLKDAFRIVAGNRVTFHGLVSRGANYELKVSLSPDGIGGVGGGGVGDAAAALSQSMQSRLRLLNAAGDALERRGFSSEGNGREIGYTIHFSRGGAAGVAGAARAGAPARLVWDVPTETQNVVVPFTFVDLPMP